MSRSDKRAQASNNNPLAAASGAVYQDDSAGRVSTSDAFKQMLANKQKPSKQEIVSTISSNEIRVGAFKFTSTGLDVDGTIVREDWHEVGNILSFLDTSLQWLIGDWALAGEELGYGDHEAFAEMFGFQRETIYQYKHVARKVQFFIRIKNLSYGHHLLVASMDESDQKYWLNQALDSNGEKRWSVKQLREAIKASKEEPKQLPLGDLFKKAAKRELKTAKKYLEQGMSRAQVARLYRQLADEIESE